MKRVYEKPDIVSESIQMSALATVCCCVCNCDANLESATFLGNWSANHYGG
jgi:hypothetical protein